MSTIVEILQSTEEVLLPDGSRMLAQVAEREEALMQASLRESTLWREREHQRLQMQRVALAGNRSNSGGYSDARSGGRRPGANPRSFGTRSGDPRSDDVRSSGRPNAGARDTNMVRPEVLVVGRAPQSTKPVRSANSQIVPEPDQIQSKRPNPHPVTGPFEPRG